MNKQKDNQQKLDAQVMDVVAMVKARRGIKDTPRKTSCERRDCPNPLCDNGTLKIYTYESLRGRAADVCQDCNGKGWVNVLIKH